MEKVKYISEVIDMNEFEFLNYDIEDLYRDRNYMEKLTFKRIKNDMENEHFRFYCGYELEDNINTKSKILKMVNEDIEYKEKEIDEYLTQIKIYLEKGYVMDEKYEWTINEYTRILFPQEEEITEPKTEEELLFLQMKKLLEGFNNPKNDNPKNELILYIQENETILNKYFSINDLIKNILTTNTRISDLKLYLSDVIRGENEKNIVQTCKTNDLTDLINILKNNKEDLFLFSCKYYGETIENIIEYMDVHNVNEIIDNINDNQLWKTEVINDIFKSENL